jgi:hypothetical protein
MRQIHNQLIKYFSLCVHMHVYEYLISVFNELLLVTYYSTLKNGFARWIAKEARFDEFRGVRINVKNI